MKRSRSSTGSLTCMEEKYTEMSPGLKSVPKYRVFGGGAGLDREPDVHTACTGAAGHVTYTHNSPQYSIHRYRHLQNSTKAKFENPSRKTKSPSLHPPSNHPPLSTRLLFHSSFPKIVAFFFSARYNVASSIKIGLGGRNSIAAVYLSL